MHKIIILGISSSISICIAIRIIIIFSIVKWLFSVYLAGIYLSSYKEKIRCTNVHEIV